MQRTLSHADVSYKQEAAIICAYNAFVSALSLETCAVDFIHRFAIISNDRNDIYLREMKRLCPARGGNSGLSCWVRVCIGGMTFRQKFNKRVCWTKSGTRINPIPFESFSARHFTHCFCERSEWGKWTVGEASVRNIFWFVYLSGKILAVRHRECRKKVPLSLRRIHLLRIHFFENPELAKLPFIGSSK